MNDKPFRKVTARQPEGIPYDYKDLSKTTLNEEQVQSVVNNTTLVSGGGGGGGTTYTAGDGLQLAGTVFSAKLDGTTLSKSASGLKVNAIAESVVTNLTTDLANLAHDLASNVILHQVFGG